MNDSRSDVPNVVVFPPLLFVGTLLVGLILHWIRPVSLPGDRLVRALGVVLLVLSGLLVRAAESAMKRAGTDPRPSQPSTAIVSSGPVWPLVLLIPLLVVLRWGVVGREERYLEAKFGDAYRGYRTRVRRWL